MLSVRGGHTKHLKPKLIEALLYDFFTYIPHTLFQIKRQINKNY